MGLVREALGVLDAESNAEEALLLKGLLGQANMLAGFVSDAVKANSAGLDLIADEGRGKAGIVVGLTVGQMVGFDVPYWLKCLHVRPLVMLGRFSEADERLGRLFQTDPAEAEPLHQGIPHYYAVELAWFRNATPPAMRHAHPGAHIAAPAGNPHWCVVSLQRQG